MWVRGLKPTPIFEGANDGIVAPHVGAWIETYLNSPNGFKLKVAPHVGAWIETVEFGYTQTFWKVAPHVGAWIETKYH